MNNGQIQGRTVAQEQKVSSVFVNDEIEYVSEDNLMLPTGALMAFLIVIMIVLKLFIYTKDPKRHGK